MRELRTEGDAFKRGLRPSDDDDDTIIVSIQPFVAIIETPVNDLDSLKAARQVIAAIRETVEGYLSTAKELTEKNG